MLSSRASAEKSRCRPVFLPGVSCISAVLYFDMLCQRNVEAWIGDGSARPPSSRMNATALARGDSARLWHGAMVQVLALLSPPFPPADTHQLRSMIRDSGYHGVTPELNRADLRWLRRYRACPRNAIVSLLEACPRQRRPGRRHPEQRLGNVNRVFKQLDQ
ncbi:hypothetical protein DPEC_G00339370 [Dallia pectoralis]|uniref:Uncharacterized protein n=1 Tax=Dallia pectoralis TaxID=75939 RepID=A0ACC2F4V6_DALPE|nr:hypothetical protein DPEC_G00339370 [Dallia pectoralis]